MCGRCVLSLMGRHNAALNLLHIHQKRNAVCMKLLCSMLVRVDTDLSYRTYSIGSECNGGGEECGCRGHMGGVALQERTPFYLDTGHATSPLAGHSEL